jgi:hypothetical protein
MNKQQLALLLQLAELASQTGRISFESMAAVGDAVLTAKRLEQQMKDSDRLEIKTTFDPQ